MPPIDAAAPLSQSSSTTPAPRRLGVVHDFPIQNEAPFRLTKATRHLAHLFAIQPRCPAKASVTDTEDWIEGVLRASAIMNAAEKYGADVYTAPRGAATPLPASSKASRDGATNELLLDLRTFTDPLDRLTNVYTRCSAARRLDYALNAGFRANAGREFILARNDTEKHESAYPHFPSVRSALTKFAGQIAFWKTFGGREKEYPVEIVDLTHYADRPQDIHVPIDIAYSLIHTGGYSSIQAYVPDMVYEYRIFVVDGVPVTGAGAVEEHTPLDANSDSGFSTLMRQRRSAAAPIEDRPDLTELYRVEAQRIVDEILTADPSFSRSFCLDLFTRLGPAPTRAFAVELNPLLASGLYACDPVRIFEALVAEHKRFTEKVETVA